MLSRTIISSNRLGAKADRNKAVRKPEPEKRDRKFNRWEAFAPLLALLASCATAGKGYSEANERYQMKDIKRVYVHFHDRVSGVDLGYQPVQAKVKDYYLWKEYIFSYGGAGYDVKTCILADIVWKVDAFPYMDLGYVPKGKKINPLYKVKGISSEGKLRKKFFKGQERRRSRW